MSAQESDGVYQRRLMGLIEPYEERQAELENNIQEIFEQKFKSEKFYVESEEKNSVLRGTYS